MTDERLADIEATLADASSCGSRFDEVVSLAVVAIPELVAEVRMLRELSRSYSLPVPAAAVLDNSADSYCTHLPNGRTTT